MRRTGKVQSSRALKSACCIPDKLVKVLTHDSMANSSSTLASCAYSPDRRMFSPATLLIGLPRWFLKLIAAYIKNLSIPVVDPDLTVFRGLYVQLKAHLLSTFKLVFFGVNAR